MPPLAHACIHPYRQASSDTTRPHAGPASPPPAPPPWRCPLLAARRMTIHATITILGRGPPPRCWPTGHDAGGRCRQPRRPEVGTSGRDARQGDKPKGEQSVQLPTHPASVASALHRCPVPHAPHAKRQVGIVVPAALAPLLPPPGRATPPPPPPPPCLKYPMHTQTCAHAHAHITAPSPDRRPAGGAARGASRQPGCGAGGEGGGGGGSRGGAGHGASGRGGAVRAGGAGEWVGGMWAT